MNYSLQDLLDNFRLKTNREDYRSVVKSIEQGIVFRGTNLWVLVFAILIASLGLNVNSPAVIIGAMLVSPLMGPILGMGLAMGINDLTLLRKAARNYGFAAVISLISSTLYFLISPINDAHSEILARTSPNIYDVLIAFIGGLAGMLATASKLKGNVITGVAIATALMPPLCTAGYGIATGQIKFFIGAFYLFIINTVFIGLATLITVRFLKFPFKEQPDPAQRLKVRRIIWSVTALTILPSTYLGYEIVQESRFMHKAEKFVEHEAVFPGDFLLRKSIDSKKKVITLTFGGKRIDEAQVSSLRQRLTFYDLGGTHLEIRQGFSVSEEKQEVVTANAQRESNIRLSRQIYEELQAQGLKMKGLSLEPSVRIDGTTEDQEIWLAAIKTEEQLSNAQQKRLHEWLKIRLKADEIAVLFEP